MEQKPGVQCTRSDWLREDVPAYPGIHLAMKFDSKSIRS